MSADLLAYALPVCVGMPAWLVSRVLELNYGLRRWPNRLVLVPVGTTLLVLLGLPLMMNWFLFQFLAFAVMYGWDRTFLGPVPTDKALPAPTEEERAIMAALDVELGLVEPTDPWTEWNQARYTPTQRCTSRLPANPNRVCFFCGKAPIPKGHGHFCNARCCTSYANGLPLEITQ